MKTDLKAGWRLAGFLALALAAVVALDWGITAGLRRVRTSSFGAYNTALRGRADADILVSGSSRALVHYDTDVMRKATGHSCFNLGRNGSHIDMQLALLRACLRLNRKPQMVIQNLDMHSLARTEEIFDPVQYLPYLREPEIYEGVLKIHPDAWKWRHIPLYGYTVEDMNFTWMLGLRGWAGLNPKEDHFSGYNPRDLTWSKDFERFKAKNPEGVRMGIDPTGIAALEAIVDTCLKNGIKVVLVYSPQYHEMRPLVKNQAEIFGHFQRISHKYHVPFLDYGLSDLCKDQNLFYNSQHLNRKGAALFSAALCNDLQPILKSPPTTTQ